MRSVLLYSNMQQAIFLMGPTAVGKTAVAMQLAELLPVDLISVDSAMVYRGMDIGTNKPTKQELTRYPHKLIDICDPRQPYSAAQFCTDATLAMQESWAQQRIPLLVGGTMLYFKALQFGLSALPSADAVLRAQLSLEAQNCGWLAMHAKLAQLDPHAAQRLNVNDTQRVQRALEINILTKKTLQENYQQQSHHQLSCKLHAFAIMPSARDELNKIIAARFEQMLAAGLIAEVAALYARGDLSIDLPTIRSVGYRQVWYYLEQQLDYVTMCEQAITATRQLAKRQCTWLRNWPVEIKFAATAPEALDRIINTMLHSE